MKRRGHRLICGDATDPADLPALPTAFSDADDLINAPSCASGTRIVTAKRAGRRCFAMEWYPVHCFRPRPARPGPLRLRRAAGLRGDRQDRLPARAVPTLVVGNQPNCPPAHFGVNLVHSLAYKAPSCPGGGGFDKRPAVHRGSPGRQGTDGPSRTGRKSPRLAGRTWLFAVGGGRAGVRGHRICMSAA